jgi:hypothetical protein
MTMRYFFDTEFAYCAERGGSSSLDLISIGIVAQDGREYYAINTPGVAKADHFVRQNVLPHLGSGPWMLDWEIAQDVVAFIHDSPEFWVYMGAFDFVLLSQLLGGFSEWPEGWPYMANDLKQLINDRGLEISQSDDEPHNAIDDARWIANTYMAVRS